MQKFCLLFVVLAACGDNRAETPDGSTTLPDATVAPDGPDVSPACLAPLVVPADPAARANAQAALTALAPDATMTWADVRGTFQSIDGLVVPLPACTGDTNAFDLLFATLSAHPALFQIDPAEWTGGVAPCSDILANGFHPLTIRRATYGSYTIAHDVFTAVADVQNGVVILRNFSGSYLPPPPADVLAQLSSCPDLSQAVLARHLFTQPFSYETYASAPAPACTVEGDHTYSAQDGDTVTYDPAITLDWTEDTQVTIQRQGVATVVVGGANYTHQLVNSSANCIDLYGRSDIGWQRTYNAATAEVLYDHATPSPYCTVCLKSP